MTLDFRHSTNITEPWTYQYLTLGWPASSSVPKMSIGQLNSVITSASGAPSCPALARKEPTEDSRGVVQPRDVASDLVGRPKFVDRFKVGLLELKVVEVGLPQSAPKPTQSPANYPKGHKPFQLSKCIPHQNGGHSKAAAWRTHSNAARCDRFGDDAEALVRAPRDEHLGGFLVDLFSDVLDVLRVDHSRLAGRVVAEGRVRGDDDAFLLAYHRSAKTLANPEAERSGRKSMRWQSVVSSSGSFTL